MRPAHEQTAAGTTAQAAQLAAFEQAVRQSSRALWSIAAAILGSRADAEDVVQEAVVVALGKRDEFPHVENFSAWMAQIVRFVALNRRRSAKLRLAEPDEAFQHVAASSLGGNTTVLDSHGQLLAGEKLFDDAVMKALNSLEETARACLLLRVLNNCSYKEIGQALDIPEGTAMSHVFRARRALIEKLTPAHGSRFGGTEQPQ